MCSYVLAMDLQAGSLYILCTCLHTHTHTHTIVHCSLCIGGLIGVGPIGRPGEPKVDRSRPQ